LRHPECTRSSIGAAHNPFSDDAFTIAFTNLFTEVKQFDVASLTYQSAQ
jgi:hypothetical protein